MIISIEGIDGVGKSTLGRELKEHYNIPLIDPNKEMLEPYQYLHGGDLHIPEFDRDSWRVAAVNIETLRLANADAILDRTTLSCWAYQQRHDKDLAYLEQVIKYAKPIIVMIDTDIDTCMERDPDVVKVGWGYDDLVYQRHRMLAAAECFAHADVPVIIVNGNNVDGSPKSENDIFNEVVRKIDNLLDN